MKMKYIKTVIVILLISLFAVPCFAEVPKLIQYTGNLIIPVKKHEQAYQQGIYDVNFHLCTDEDCTTFIWSEVHTVEISHHNHQETDDGKATFTVLLGSINPFVNVDGNKIVFDQDYYLLVTENTKGHSNIEKLVSSPYAIRSDFANYADTVYDSDTGEYTSLQDITINKAKDADTVDGKHYSDIVQYIKNRMPSGVIVMWSGTTIPQGWHLCDGTNGTPDLSTRFIVSTGSTYNLGDTGGINSNNLSVAQLPPHTHSGTTSSVNLSGNTNAAGNHSHRIKGKNLAVLGNQGALAHVYGAIPWNLPPCTSTDGNHTHSFNIGSHSHSITLNNTGAGNAIDNRPAYYSLAFIMKL